MPDGVDPTRSAESVAGLQRSDLSSGELEASLRAVADATTKIFDADGGGIMLLDDQQALHYVGATSGTSAALEAAQEELGEGPCVDSLVHGVVTSTPDLLADERWPLLRSEVGDLGVHALLGVPLHLDRSAIGSLNVYRMEPYEWAPRDVEAIEAHAQVIEELLAVAMRAQRNHTIVQQLTTALQNRVTIERAVGVVIATAGLDAVKAFNELRLLARSQRVKVADLAAAVVASRSFPPAAEAGS
jgi:transcriptional regulator with GAF, ATPase, and Fis domain